MIVKNEEENLPRCLGSIRNFVDEIIVVDTGSTDKTQQICEQFGAKIFHHEWTGNFSEHRNQATGYSTGDWIFVVDADEELCFEKNFDPAKLRKQMDNLNGQYSAVAMTLRDIQDKRTVMQFAPIRFFKKDRFEGYKRAIHNKPVFKGQAGFLPGFYLKHYGYDLSPEEMEKKRQRTLKGLRQSLIIDPTDYECYFYLNQLYNLSGDYERCIDAGEKYIAHRDELKKFNPTVYFTTVRSCMTIKDKKRAEKYLKIGYEDFPENMDICFVVAEYGMWVKNISLIEKGALKYIELYDKYIDRGITNDPHCFTFSFNPDCLAKCMYACAMVRLQSGAEFLKQLNRVWPQVSKSAGDSMKKGLIKDLTLAGFPDLAKTVPYEEQEEQKAQLQAVK